MRRRPFSNKPIVLWISNSDDFLNPLGQHLIFRFDTNFNTDPASNQVIGLNPSAGELLVGEFGNYSYDYGFSSGVLPGFNLESVIPEPSTYALVIGAALLAVAAVRRGRARA